MFKKTFKEILIIFGVLVLIILIGAGIIKLVITIVSSIPRDVPSSQIKEKDQSYEIIFSGKTKTPSWVVQVLNNDIVEIHETSYHFKRDPEIPSIIQPQVSDYEKSGFDIGLLLFPTSVDDIHKIFYLSHSAPFVPEFKNGYWEKLNAYIRKLTKNTKIVVISGPLYLAEEIVNGKKYIKYQIIGENKVAVPSHFFRIIYTSSDSAKTPEIYVVPNENINSGIPLKTFQLQGKEFEKMSGVLLPEETETYFPLPATPMM